MTQENRTFAIGGGLDQASPALTVQAGRARAAMNYEATSTGYSSIDGYERWDGRTLPSEATFWTMPYRQGTSPFVQGNTVTGATSGATGVLLIDPVNPSGSWASGTAAGTLVLTNVQGTFQLNEPLRVAGSPKAVCNGTATKEGTTDVALYDAWLQLAQDYQRSLIQAVPGNGPVLAVWMLKGDLYAVRSLGDQPKIYKATATGWQQLEAAYLLGFKNGMFEPSEQSLVRGKSSNATAVVWRVIRMSGSWGTDARGILVVRQVTGSFFEEYMYTNYEDYELYGAEYLYATRADTGASGQFAVTHTPPEISLFMAQVELGMFSTSMKVVKHNFFGNADSERIYGICSDNFVPFEFDGTVIVPIFTNNNGLYAPPQFQATNIAVHQNSLCVAYPGGSLQLSVPGDPLSFDGELGAAEFGIGSDITDLQPATETALAVFAESKIGVLTGTDIDTYQWTVLTDTAGAFAGTAQNMGQTLYMDHGGLRSLAAAQNFANFKIGSYSELIDPLLAAKRTAGAKPVLSYICRAKAHYRLIWDDGTGISVYMGRKTPEIMPFELGDTRFKQVWSDVDPVKGEIILAAGEDGYVYRLDSGTSMDGDPITGFVMFPFNHLGSPFMEKRMHGVQLELDAAPRTNIGLTVQFDYADGEQPHDGAENFFVQGSTNRDFVVSGGGGIWDASYWNQFFWSAPFEGQAWSDIDGIGTNMSLLVASRRTAVEPSHTLKSYSLFYSPRKQRRRYG